MAIIYTVAPKTQCVQAAIGSLVSYTYVTVALARAKLLQQDEVHALNTADLTMHSV